MKAGSTRKLMEVAHFLSKKQLHLQRLYHEDFAFLYQELNLISKILSHHLEASDPEKKFFVSAFWDFCLGNLSMEEALQALKHANPIHRPLTYGLNDLFDLKCQLQLKRKKIGGLLRDEKGFRRAEKKILRIIFDELGHRPYLKEA